MRERPPYACSDEEVESDGWFSVSWATTPDQSDPKEFYFVTATDAEKYRDEIQTTYRFIWISEYGRVTLQSGREEEQWVIYWWSDSTDLAEKDGPFGRGQGFEWSNYTFREYEPMNGEPIRKY